MQNDSISCQINQLYPVIFPKRIFRKRNRKIQRTNTKLNPSNNAIANRLTRDSSSLWRELFSRWSKLSTVLAVFQLAEVHTSLYVRRITGLV